MKKNAGKRGGRTEVLSTTSIFNNTDVNIKQPQYISANMTYKDFITDYKASKSSKPSTTYEEFIQKDIENITTITNTFTNNKNKNDNDNIGLIHRPTDEEKAKITNLLSSDDYKIIRDEWFKNNKKVV